MVHVLAKGRIQATGGPELAAELEDTGYAEWTDDEAESAQAPTSSSAGEDPFADPFA